MKILKIYLSLLAEKKLLLLLDYLEQKWGKKSKSDFVKKLQICVNQIAKQPNSCAESKQMQGIFKCVVSKQTSFYYQVTSDSIEIITVIDNRQNPFTSFEELKKFFNSPS